MNTLNQLKQMTTIVADTGDLQAIARLQPIDATTNPSLITKAFSDPKMVSILQQKRQKSSNLDTVIDDLTLYLGKEILTLITGRVSTEIDARLAYDTQGTIDKALQFIENYQQLGVDVKRVLIKIPATWQGIIASEYLEKQGVHCNLTLLFGLHQAKACADAGVTLISPFVGRILDWQKKAENTTNIDIHHDKGVQSVTTIYHYYKQHGYQTQVMGASFRSVAQILALAGCDLLTIAPELLDDMANMNQDVVQQLSKDMRFIPMIQQHLNKSNFQQQLSEDMMSQELLTTGIDGFVKAREVLLQLLHNLSR